MMVHKNSSAPSTEIPSGVHPKYEAITALTDAFCLRHLNEEYAEMCRRLTDALAKKRPTPLVRGRAEVWACGIVRTIGWANILDDPKQAPYMKLIDIDPEFGVAESTGRAAACRNGLIPYIPADQTKTKDDQASKPSPSLHSVEGNLFSTLLDFHKRVIALLRAAKPDDDTLDIAAERIGVLLDKATNEISETKDLNIQPRLDSMYREVKAFVDELSHSPRKQAPKSP